MLKHLDDPGHHELPPDFRDRVRRRGASLRRRRRLGGVVALSLVLVVAAAAGLYARAYDRVDQVERLTVAGTDYPVTDGSDRTILVVGVDTVTNDPQRLGPPRTDTILIVRLHDDRASVLSVPRDLAVDPPEAGDGQVRINTVAASYGYGGLVRVIGAEFDIGIDHFVEVGMDGFASLVDLVGGIDVNFVHHTRDLRSGLHLDAGCQRLDGDQALALARARTPQQLRDGRWRTDPRSDLGRIDRQPTLLTSGLQALARTRPDPISADRLAGWLADHAAVDDNLGNKNLVALVRTVLSLAPEDFSFTTVAVEDHVLADGAAVLRLAEPAEDTVARWTTGAPAEVAGPGENFPRDVEVSVSPCDAK